MREMGIYRGQTKDGEWVEGFLCFHYVDGKNENGFVYTGKSKIYDQENVKSCDVITETVGEWTGLTDENGKRIFEGDIVEEFCWVDGHRKQGAVYFDDLHLQFLFGDYHILLKCSIYERKVIGNIHDNPELVKE